MKNPKYFTGKRHLKARGLAPSLGRKYNQSVKFNRIPIIHLYHLFEEGVDTINYQGDHCRPPVQNYDYNQNPNYNQNHLKKMKSLWLA